MNSFSLRNLKCNSKAQNLSIPLRKNSLEITLEIKTFLKYISSLSQWVLSFIKRKMCIDDYFFKIKKKLLTQNTE